MLNKNDFIKKERVKHGSIFRTIYTFFCNCGKKLRIRSDFVKTHSGKCLSCCHKKKPFETHYNTLRRSAKLRKLKVKLTYKQFLEFTKTSKCNYCKDKINWNEHTTYKKLSKRSYLDRVNNGKGYSKENCVVCCVTCNMSRGNRFTHEEFLLIGKVIKKIREKRNGSNQS